MKYFFLLVIIFGLAVRLFFVGNTGFLADISFWKSWSLAAADHGIVWTAYNTNINYPPGFIYVLWFMGKLYSLIGNPHDYNTYWRDNNFGFLLASKSIAIAADVAIACLIYWFFSQKEKLKKLGLNINNSQPITHNLQLINHLPLLLSSIFFLNPVVILDSALWGQVESFGILFTLVAIVLIFYKHPLWATAIFTAGCLMKLQNIIYIPLYFLFILRYFDPKTVLKAFGVAAAAFFLVNLPFLWHNDMKQVLYLMTVNGDYFPWLSLNAHNLWWIRAAGEGMKITDRITVLGILNAKTVGLMLFSSCYFLSAILIFLKPSPRNFLLSLTFGIFAFFLFTTQSHERYSYPVIVLLLLLYPFLETNYFHHSNNSKIKNQKSQPKADQPRAEKIQFKIQNLESAKDTSGVAGWNAVEAMTPLRWRYQKYFWVLYFLLTAAIFFNIHTGLILNYPYNGFATLTGLTTPSLTVLNSYLMIFLFLLLLPFIFSQISPLFSVFCSLFFVFSLLILQSSYIAKGQVSLTFFKPIITQQDYGVLKVNKTVNSDQWKSWNRLSNNYFFYRKGFGSHANSYLVFDIDRKFREFTTDFGVDTEAGTQASVIFKIFGDGKLLFQSDKMGRFDFPGHTQADVTGVKRLELSINDAGDGINNDHADWLNPVLYK